MKERRLRKFGWKTLIYNPVRLTIALISAAVCFGIAGMCVFCDTYDTRRLDREQYFSKVTHAFLQTENKYTLLQYEGERGAYREAAARIERDLEGMGVGYAIAYHSQVNLDSSYGDRIPVGGELYQFGPYALWQSFGEGNSQYKIFCEENGKYVLAPYVSPDISVYDMVRDPERLYAEAHSLVDELLSDVVMYGDESVISEFGGTLYGKYPTEADEIAIPQWLYDSYRLYGFRDYETGQVTKISSEEDIIGKRLRFNRDVSRSMLEDVWDIPPEELPFVVPVRIVGVAHCDYEKEPPFDAILPLIAEKGRMTLSEFFMYYSGCATSPATGIIVSRTLYESLRVLTDDVEGLTQPYYYDTIDVLRFGAHSEEIFEYATAWKQGRGFSALFHDSTTPRVTYYEDPINDQGRIGYRAALTSVYHDSVEPYFSYTPYLMVFSVAFLAYFAASTVLSRRKSMGVLQSLGAGKRELSLAFILPFLLFTLIVSLLAFGVEGIFIGVLNRKLQAVYAAQDHAVKIAEAFPFTMTAESVLLTIFGPLAVMFLSLCVLFVVFSRFSVVENLDRGKRGGRGGGRRGEKPSKRDNHSEGERPCD